MQEIIDQLIVSDRFSMKLLYASVWSVFSTNKAIAENISILKNTFSKNKYKQLACGILRHAFLIELVKIPGIETTKFRTRWYSQLSGDPRECSFEECLEIAQDLVVSLTSGWLNNPENFEVLTLFLEYRILPYELPIDYLERPAINDMVTRIHRRDNIAWIIDENILRTLKLRQYLTNLQTSPDARFFKKVINKKIKDKTYLTDRAKTGLYKTNREKRWETHPHSVQFALRRVCMAIEHKLITQLCVFEGFPNNFKEMLQVQGIIPSELQLFRCPVTFEPMSFQDFREKLMNPTHGKSNFQIGHLHPLKLDKPSTFIVGHSPGNISWISEDGNRIQGHMSIEAIRSLLVRITRNYEDQNLL